MRRKRTYSAEHRDSKPRKMNIVEHGQIPISQTKDIEDIMRIQDDLKGLQYKKEIHDKSGEEGVSRERKVVDVYLGSDLRVVSRMMAHAQT